MKFYAGRSNVYTHYEGYLIPVYRCCSFKNSTVEEASLLGRVLVKISLDNDEAEEYSFNGFVKVNTILKDATEF